MKQRILTSLAALVCFAVGYADNISLGSITLKPGETKELKVSLSSVVNGKAGVQFDLTLPEGVSLEKNSDNQIYKLSSNQASDMTCHVSDLGNRTSRFVLYSNTLKKLKEGDLMSLNLKVASNKDLGNYTISMSNVAFSDEEGRVAKESGTTVTIKVTNFFTLLYKVDGEDYRSYQVEYGATITPEPAPTKVGHIFSGWSEIPKTMPAHDVTVTGTFTIEEAVVVTAKSYSRKYGEANPTFEFTTSGAALKGTPSITCSATATSPVGEYDIVVSKGSVTNYNVTFVNGKLTVTKAPLTITAKSYTIKQGDALPTFEAEYAGFKNNETATVLQKAPTLSTAATSASEPGTYEIVVSGAEAQNYELSYVKGTLTISARDVEPVTETGTTTFSEQVNENTDLSNTIIGNTYFTLNAENGDGYDANEQAVVLNTTTTTEQMNSVQNAAVGDEALQQNYNGLIFEIPDGTGKVTVDVKTIGTHVLNVQIGKGEPTKITKSERGTVDVDYNVASPTYVYLYASSTTGSAAPMKHAPSANSVLLYGYKVIIISTGIGVVISDENSSNSWYSLDGKKQPKKPTTKGLYIHNGRKVVVR